MERRCCPICLEEVQPRDAAVLRCARAGCAGEFHYSCAALAASSSPLCPLCRRPAEVEWALDVLREQLDALRQQRDVLRGQRDELRGVAEEERRLLEDVAHAAEEERARLRGEAEEMLLLQRSCLAEQAQQERKAALELVAVALSQRETLALQAKQEQNALRLQLLDARRELNARGNGRSRTPKRRSIQA